MPRRASKKTPVVLSGYVYTSDRQTTGTGLDSPAWFAWLDDEATTSFYYQGDQGGLTVRREVKQRGGRYWIAYRWVAGRLHKVYLGLSPRVTQAALEAAWTSLLAREAGE